MRRGLMGRDENELPLGVLEERTARVQAAMARDGLDALVFYTNIVRPSAVTWLTGFTPYWSDGLLLLPRSGAPVFATALSKRVADWIRTTNPMSEIVNTPKPGAAIGARLAAAGAKRVGVLEFDTLPAGLYDEIMGAAPAVELRDAGTLFTGARCSIDAAERALIAHADALAVAALDQITVDAAQDGGVVAGLVEKHARLAGAEETFVAVAADLDADRRLIRISRPTPLAGRFAVRASIAYKGSWVRRTRTFARDDAGVTAVKRGDEWLARVVASFSPGAAIAAQLSAPPDSELKSWMAESCVGSYPLEMIAGDNTPRHGALAAGEFVVLSAALSIGGVPWLGAAPAFVGGR